MMFLSTQKFVPMVALFTFSIGAIACPVNLYHNQIKFIDDVMKTPGHSALDATEYKGKMNRHTFVREVLKPLSDKKAVEGFEVLPGK